MDRQTLRDHCVTLMDFYQKQGVVHPVGELLSAVQLFPHVAEARMRYRMQGEGTDVIAEWEHVYILRRTDCWHVTLTIADGEMAAWAKRGAQL